mgnify:CR=1 FL=1
MLKRALAVQLLNYSKGGRRNWKRRQFILQGDSLTYFAPHARGKGKKLGSGLPTIWLKDIGKDKKGGATPAEVVNKIMETIETQVSIAVGATGGLRKLFDK